MTRSAARLRAWLDPLPNETKRQSVWKITFEIEGGPGMSQTWGWRATRFSPEYDLLCSFSDSDDEEPVCEVFSYVPLGLIDHSDHVRSAALVLLSQEQTGQRLVFNEGEITCATGIRSGLGSKDVYRLMLAWSGFKGAVSMSDRLLISLTVRGCDIAMVEELEG
jgi:hypothetical protein